MKSPSSGRMRFTKQVLQVRRRLGSSSGNALPDGGSTGNNKCAARMDAIESLIKKLSECVMACVMEIDDKIF